MVTQHRKPASATMMNTTFGGHPSTVGRAPPVAAVVDSCSISGGGRRKMIASGTMMASCRIANPIIVRCQPKYAIERSKIVGQTNPAR